MNTHKNLNMTTSTTLFKLDHDQLEALLPPEDFEGSLEMAVVAVNRALNADPNDGTSNFVPGLLHVLENEQFFPHPVQLLRDIRTWALAFLKHQVATFPSNPLASPPLPANENETMATATRTVTAAQARGVLANAFFANCRDLVTPFKDDWKEGGLDWRPLLRNTRYAVEGVERMRCHLLYFVASQEVSNDDDSRKIIFERICYKPQNFLQAADDDATRRPAVGTGIVLHNQAMEQPTRRCTGFVNFANPNFGYGEFIPSCTQEEILISCCPEFTVGMLWIGKMKSNEVVLCRHARRYAKYKGYLGTFQCTGPLNTDAPFAVQDILTMDACYNHHFTAERIQRDVNKAYFAFQAIAASAAAAGAPRPVISTGKWGCGAFGGMAAHKFVQQVLAANLAGVDLDFSAFGNAELCDIVLEALQTHKPTARAVAKALVVCDRPESFAQDFVRSIAK